MASVLAHRRDLEQLVRLAQVDLDVLWRQVRSAAVAEDMLGTILPSLVRTYGQAAGVLAAEWYEEIRAELDLPGSFRATVADLPPTGRTESLARWATEPLRSTDELDGRWKALQRANGGLQRIIANADRETIMWTSLTDPHAEGWSRFTSADACGHCRMLADRGAVYTEQSVDFGAHDHCGCMAMPEFGTAGDAIFTDRKVTNPRKIGASQRAATKRWMAEHGY